MTKKTNNKDRQLKLLKLVSGNTVLAEVRRVQGGEKLEVTNPMEIVVMPDPRDSRKTIIQLMDFLPASAQEVMTMRSEHVICMPRADEKVEDLYRQAINPQQSAIAQPQEPKLLLP